MNTSATPLYPSAQGQDLQAQAEGSAEAFAAALRRGDWRSAERHLRHARSQAAPSLAWALRESDWYLAQQRWDEAARLPKDLLALPSVPDEFQLAVRHNLASTAFARRDHAGSVAWLSPMLEAEGVPKPLPDGFRATQLLWARSLHRSGDLDRLHRWVAQVDALGRLDAAVAGVAGLASWDRADHAAAKRWSSMGRENGTPSTAECVVTDALLALADRDSSRAQALVEKAVDLWPGEARAWVVLGFARLVQGDGKQAALSFERATALAPDDVLAWLGQGWALALSGRGEAGQRSFDAALALNDRDAEAHGGLAVALAFRGRAAEAKASLARCLDLDPESRSATYAERILVAEDGQALDLAALFVALMQAPRKTSPVPTRGDRSSVVPGGAGSVEHRIAVVTPTWERPRLLLQTLRYFFAQDVMRPENLHWFVLDDSAAPSSISRINDPRIHYVHLPRRATLGAKRNQLNEMARQWGADFICSMDDDDWYGPSYVGSMVALLQQQPGHQFAGSSKDYYYHLPTATVMQVGASGPDHSCNAVLCYRASALEGRRYDDSRQFGEEPSFLNGADVVQHPDIGKVHLALAHAGNTVSKESIFQTPACHTALQLSEFPMQPEDQAFYRRFTEYVAKQSAAPRGVLGARP